MFPPPFDSKEFPPSSSPCCPINRVNSIEREREMGNSSSSSVGLTAVAVAGAAVLAWGAWSYGSPWSSAFVDSDGPKESASTIGLQVHEPSLDDDDNVDDDVDDLILPDLRSGEIVEENVDGDSLMASREPLQIDTEDLTEKGESKAVALKGARGILNNGDQPKEEREGVGFQILESESNLPLIVYGEDRKLTLDKRTERLRQREPWVGGRAVEEDEVAQEERKGDYKGKGLIANAGRHTTSLAHREGSCKDTGVLVHSGGYGHELAHQQFFLQNEKTGSGLTFSPKINSGTKESLLMQPAYSEQLPIFSSIHKLDRELLKEAMDKTLENLIKEEDSTSTRRRRPSRQRKRFRMRTTLKPKTQSSETPIYTLGFTNEGERVLDGTLELGAVEEDEERIPVAQEGPISSFEEITGIPDPPPTTIPTRRSKRLSEKRGYHNYQSGHILSFTSKRKALHVNLDKGIIKIMTYNIWNLKHIKINERMKAIGKLIQKHAPDIILLQEVTPMIYKIFQNFDWWGLYECSHKKSKRKYFCMLLSKLPMKTSYYKPFENTTTGKGLHIAKFKTRGNKKLVVATCHLKRPTSPETNSTVRQSQANEALSSLQCAPNVILGGDMNWDESSDGPFPLPGNWDDAWSILRPEEDGWTYDTESNMMLRHRRRALQKRLDRFICKLKDFEMVSIYMIGQEAIPKVTYRSKGKRLAVLPSDHYGLMLVIKPKQ